MDLQTTKLVMFCALAACLLLFSCAPISTFAPAPSSPTAASLEPTATSEPAAVILRGLIDALNTGDKVAALALVADDAEVYQRDVYYRGRDQVAVWLREDIDGYRDHFDIIEIKTDDGKVTGLVRVISAGSGSYHKASDYLFTFQVVVRGNKITCLNVGHGVAGLC